MDSLLPIDDNTPSPYDDGKDHQHDEPYFLGSPAFKLYGLLSGRNRQQVIERGREMSEITIPSVMPPLNYRTGDWLPGTNQSINAIAINNLSSKIMFMAFPPGQPMLRLVPVEQKLQKSIDADPQLYSMIQLALSRVELAHREKAAAINIATAWVNYIKLLLISGNALWKHITLNRPTFHSLDYFVVSRDAGGHPQVTIHKEPVRLNTLPDDVQAMILEETPALTKVEEWSREVNVYSVCRLRGHHASKREEDWSWEYWEETEKGTLIEGTEVTTDYDDCPMWPGWMIPVYGQNYGRSYCEEYRGDHYIVESGSSALNDGATMAGLSLMFVKPGARTSLRQVQAAKNLSFLSGSAEDVSVFRAEKQGDFQFVDSWVSKAEMRINKAYLVMSSVIRQGERVTAEEVERTGQDLDQAMGGLYTQIAQAHQRVMVQRMVHLHNESNESMPSLPPDVIKVQVVTGVDAMGRSADTRALTEFATDLTTVFPQKVQDILDPEDYATRSAASRGIKPDGLVKSQAAVQAAADAQQQKEQQASVMSNAAGPVAGQLAKGMADRMPPGPMTPPPGAGLPPPVSSQPPLGT